jgi:hypothetical protein
MTNTTTRRRRRTSTTAEQLDAMPPRHAHVVPLERCPGLPGIKMNGAHVFRYDDDTDDGVETRCTRCDVSLPDGLCLACGRTLYVSTIHGDLRDAATGESRCAGTLMRAAEQPSFPYDGTAHVLRADDPLIADVKLPEPGKTPARETPPPGIVCVTCRRHVYAGEGHAEHCAWKARSEAYNADLRERLLRADQLAAEERARRADRRETLRVAADSDGETSSAPRTRAAARTIDDNELCDGSGKPVTGEVVRRARTVMTRCDVCSRSVPISEKSMTIRRHKPGKGTRGTSAAPPASVDVEPVVETPKPAKQPKAAKATPTKAKPARKTNGRSALSAKAVVHALRKGTPVCGATIQTLSKTADPVTCAKCVRAADAA